MRKPLSKMLTKEGIEELFALGTETIIPAGGYFVRAGEVPKKLAFVNSGLFRYLYINDKGETFTKGIIEEDSFIVSYSSMITKTASHFYIEALEDSEIIEIPYSQWNKLSNKDLSWNKFLIQLLQNAFIIKEKRERDFLLLDAQTRYQNFMEENPTLQNRVKQTIIASYLGIQPESLSRIKKKLSS